MFEAQQTRTDDKKRKLEMLLLQSKTSNLDRSQFGLVKDLKKAFLLVMLRKLFFTIRSLENLNFKQLIESYLGKSKF